MASSIPTTPGPSSSSILPYASQASGQGKYRMKSASPLKLARFSPCELPRKSSSATHLTGHPHAHPNVPPPPFGIPSQRESEGAAVPPLEYDGKQVQHAFHVDPGFSLVHDGEPRFPSEDEQKFIFDLFPSCTCLTTRPPFLIVCCQRLPPKPWPVTLAGLPLYLTSDPDAEPRDIGNLGLGPGLTVDAKIHRTLLPGLETFIQIFSALDEYDTKTTKLQWVSGIFLAMTKSKPKDGWRLKYPKAVNGVIIGYVFGEDAIDERAPRVKFPHGRTCDDSEYSELCPGVMIQSRTKQTTSGVCVRDRSGAKYMTAAAHAFSDVGDEVWHPNDNGVHVGNFSKKLGDSDIALVKLRDGIKYSRQTFHNPGTPTAKPFKDFVDVKTLKTYTRVMMNTPLNGHVEGSLIGVQVHRSPTDEAVRPWEYLPAALTYFGNGGHTILEGSGGAVLWTAENDNGDGDWIVLGQFRFQVLGKDICYCPTYSQMAFLGYSLSET